MSKCRICPAAATRFTVYVVELSGPTNARVRHATCDKHFAGLHADMLDAGWKVAG